MTPDQHRDLYDLLVAGASARYMQGVTAAFAEPAATVSALMDAFGPEDADKFHTAINERFHKEFGERVKA